jgi:acyl phosphate:glycerol-3-phosphate acyltransferase
MPSWLTSLPACIAALVFGYLLGSIPFGIIVTRFAGTQDIRSIGSGNIGATNVLRTGRKELAAATLLGDMLKGTVAVLITYQVGGEQTAILAGLGAFLGHLFPVWLKFQGGKGVATYIGVLLGLAWPGAIAFCLIWLVVAALSRYSSLAALIGSLATPIFLWLHGDRPQAAVFLILTALLWFMHRANIARLIAGSEGKIGKTASPAPER